MSALTDAIDGFATDYRPVDGDKRRDITDDEAAFLADALRIALQDADLLKAIRLELFTVATE